VLDTTRLLFERFFSHGLEVEPLLLVLSSEGLGTVPVGPYMATDDTKDALMASLSDIASSDHDVSGFALITEIWAAEGNKDGDTKPPAERDDKRELVMVRLDSREEGVEVWAASITATSQGRLLGEFEKMPVHGGRMAATAFVPQMVH
jgi:hypothetical protein